MTLLLGGARSGKSEIALGMAARSDRPVTFVATGEPLDDEFAERIEKHRASRPGGWETIEEPIEVERALMKAPDEAFVIVDCLTLWISNLFGRDFDDDTIFERANSLAACAESRPCPVVVVSNEVGLGIVPADPVSRRYRDCLGHVNATFAARASTSLLVVAGYLLTLDSQGSAPPSRGTGPVA